VRDALRDDLESLFPSKSRTEWDEQLADEETQVSPVKTPKEALSDPQIRERGMIREGSPRRIGFPARFIHPAETERTGSGIGRTRRRSSENYDTPTP
jgi:crotonobetainyl-CoA:carnitine CoA-transferase CaiB-like acyl-CoA transferase